jgi:hypothetical protein
LPHQRLWGGPRPRSATTRYGNHPALYRAGFAACRQTLSTSTRNGCSSTFAINKTSDCFLRVGCELDSWIMVGADGLGSKEDVRVFNLIVLAQFVWRVSSAAIPARRPQVVAPPDRMPRPYRVRRTRRDVRQRVSAPMGQWSTADGIRPGPGHRGAGRLCSPETLKPVHHFPAPGPLATEGGGVDGR